MKALERISFGRNDEFLTMAVVSGALGTLIAGALAWLFTGKISYDGALAGAAVGVLVGGVKLPLAVRLLGAGMAFVMSIILAGFLRASEVAVGVLALAFAFEAQSTRAKVTSFIGVLVAGAWAWAVTYAFAMPHLKAPWLGVAAPMFDGLFLGLGAWLGSMRISADAVELKLTAISGASEAWTRVRNARAKFPASASLSTLVMTGAERLIAAARTLDEVRIDEQLEKVTRDAVTALTERLAETTDEELKSHLTQTLRVHRDVLEQLDSLKRQKERAAAHVRAHVSWLETVAFSLETAPQSALGDVTDRLAKLAPA